MSFNNPFYRRTPTALIVAFSLLSLAALGASPEVRIKDIAEVQGLRDNQLLGIGLITGLAGKGDSSSSAVLQEALSNLVTSFGLDIRADQMKSRNAAVVMVSAELPPFARPGERIDLAVSSLGDARSLEGGILLQTNLQAANGTVYAVGQGRVSVSSGAKAVNTVGAIEGGAIVERAVLSEFITDNTLSLILRQADFVTATAVAAKIREAIPDLQVSTPDPAMVQITVPEDRREDIVGFVGQIEALTVRPDASGKVVVDAQTGIVVMGENVRIAKVAVSYREVDVTVGGSSFFYEEAESKNPFVIEETTRVEDFVSTLRSVGLDTDIIIEILKALDRAGALFGTLVIM